jgi:transglutaminase-like putative cysteine protease
MAYGQTQHIVDRTSSATSIIRSLRFTITIENPTAQILVNQRVWLYMPAKLTATQRLQVLNVGAPHLVTADVLGNTIIELPFDHFAAYATRIVNVSAQVRMFSEPEVQPLGGPDTFLAHEPYIEVNDPAIQMLARKLRRDTSLATVREIYDWVRENLGYAGYIADDLGARYALQNLRGDCTEYAYLAVALARANGVPARVMGGYVVDRDATPRAGEYHNWAEVYVDGAWWLLDAQKENFLTKTEQYVAFRIVSGQFENAVGTAHRFRVLGNLIVRMG